ncbi:MAG TPA: amidohydrolase family protein, partial [Gemmatimonadales bacterium]|nr:amidohydrolase family protein [Gemmatimonadales bacterium]
MIPSRIVFGLLLVGLAACSGSQPDGIALLGATLIDGSGGPPLRDAALVVRRGHVESIGTRAGFELPKKTTELDLTGRWIIPGLIDAHTHISPAATWAPTRFLAWGVTTVRDVHGSLDAILALRKQENTGTVPGPRIYAAGAMIDGLPTTYDDAIGVSSDREARKAVDRLVSAGVDFIKVYTHIDPTLLRAIIDEARTFNLSVTGHLGMTDAVTAANAGISCIEHMTGVPEAASPGRSALVAAHYRGFFPGWTASERSWAD